MEWSKFNGKTQNRCNNVRKTCKILQVKIEVTSDSWSCFRAKNICVVQHALLEHFCTRWLPGMPTTTTGDLTFSDVAVVGSKPRMALFQTEKSFQRLRWKTSLFEAKFNGGKSTRFEKNVYWTNMYSHCSRVPHPQREELALQD